jgi:alpha-ketoglutarate-dependent taurine dioxygenase
MSESTTATPLGFDGSTRARVDRGNRETCGYRLRPLTPFGVELVPSDGLQERDAADGALTPPDAKLMVQLAEKFGIAVARGAPALSREELAAYGRAGAKDPSAGDGGLLAWDFGSVMELAPDPGAVNYLHSREAVPFHWDGAFHKVPLFLVFSCTEAPGEGETDGGGGQTIFANTERVWQTADPLQKQRWGAVQLTYATEKLAHYGGEVTVRLVDRHPARRTTILRFAEPVTTKLNPVSLTVTGVSEETGREVVDELTRRLYEDDVCYVHEWRQGDLVIADNHALVHGRKALTARSERRIRRVQIL